MTGGPFDLDGDVWTDDFESLESGAYSGLLMSRYADPLFMNALRDPPGLVESAGAEVLFDGRNKIVAVKAVFSKAEKKDVVIKKFAVRGVSRFKTLVQPSKAVKAWRGARALEDRGIGTPDPIAYLEKRKRGLVDECYFISGRVRGYDEIRGHFLRPQPGVLETLLPSLAKFVAACHKAGILHRDLSDGNVLVRRGAGADWNFLLLDTNRIRVRRRLSRLAKVKNLIRLGVPRHHQQVFLRGYFGEAGLKPAWRIWYRLTKSTYAFYLQLKKALRLKKLARRLRIQ